MYIQGSMMAALRQYMGHAAQIALLVIDEADNAVAAEGENSNTPLQVIPDSNITACQQRLLMYMQRMGCHVWSIRYLPGLPTMNDYDDGTRTNLRALYDGTQHTLTKPEPNAFRETTLHTDLQQLGVNRLVIMGFSAQACVEATVGNQYWPTGTPEDGATHLGYAVMTCNQILHGGPAKWYQANPVNGHYTRHG